MYKFCVCLGVVGIEKEEEKQDGGVYQDILERARTCEESSRFTLDIKNRELQAFKRGEFTTQYITKYFIITGVPRYNSEKNIPHP